jgi:GNAT superfamily N-acetyltransferase
MDIRPLQSHERVSALNLALDVFMEFVAPDYSKQGVGTFRSYIEHEPALNTLTFYGAFESEALIGMIAMRSSNHISLFFVDSRFHGRGVGRRLFALVRSNASAGVITVHSSPYAVPIYKKLGFTVISEEHVSDGIRYVPMKFLCGATTGIEGKG